MAKNPSSPYVPLARKIARQQGVPESLLLALITAESGWNPTAGSPAGARGLTQLMPGTARGLGVRDVTDPAQNLRGGARYLRQQLDRFGDPRLALSAYNSGPGGSEASGQVEGFAETQAYVQRVMALEAQYSGGAGPGPLATMMGTSGSIAPAEAPPDTAAPGGGADITRPPAPGLPSLHELISRVGPTSEMAADQIASDQQAAPEAPTSEVPQGATEAGGQFTDQQGQVPVTDGGQPAVGGLNAEFARRFKLLQQAVKQAGGELYIYSGGRDAQHQAQLYQNALRKYGSEAEARKWVAPPGKSNHDTHAGMKYGLGDGAVASDLRGDLALAHKLAARFGLVFPLSNEAWHIELAGIRNMR